MRKLNLLPKEHGLRDGHFDRSKRRWLRFFAHRAARKRRMEAVLFGGAKEQRKYFPGDKRCSGVTGVSWKKAGKREASGKWQVQLRLAAKDSLRAPEGATLVVERYPGTQTVVRRKFVWKKIFYPSKYNSSITAARDAAIAYRIELEKRYGHLMTLNNLRGIRTMAGKVGLAHVAGDGNGGFSSDISKKKV